MPKIEQSYLKQEPEKMGLEPSDVISVGGGSGPPPEPQWPVYNRFLATPLPLIATYQPDALRQFYRGGIPQQRIFPIQNG